MGTDCILSLDGISKSFGESRVLNGISLSVFRGEFITLLGESGCGKTTTLRIIAGFETADGGRVLLNGKDVTDMPPDRRDVNTVFQNYALFPHMNVRDNIAYGPRVRGESKDKIKDGITEMLRLVRMDGYEKRMPHQLSGGQRQRVAIARALINRPLILLLDEPLGALDLKLRQHMQAELKSIQRQAGVTFIYVTHDQEEALNMSDRIVVMKDGGLCQTAAPMDIYNSPATRFVAEFVGDRNIVPVKLIGEESGFYACDLPGGKVLARNSPGLAAGADAYLAVHTDKTRIFPLSGTGGEARTFCVDGVVTDKGYTGARTKTSVMTEAGLFNIIEYNTAPSDGAKPGDRVIISWEPDDAVLVN